MLTPIDSNTVTMTPADARDLFCVFAHMIPPYDTVFYIGVGKLSEVFNFRTSYRNSHWRETIKDDTAIKITILATSPSLPECNGHLRILFNQYRPIANIKGFEMAGKALITCVTGPNAGKVYETQKDAAEKNGITPGSLANHLNGTFGYETVRGMKFKRGVE